MTNLSTRAERGDDARTLILALNDALIPAMSDEQADAFARLLAINTPEAHLAAAMMLIDLDEGVAGPGHAWFPCIERTAEDLGRTLYWSVSLAKCFERFRGKGPTPAHALIAAIARSMEHGD
jgi:hypothetical protein